MKPDTINVFMASDENYAAITDIAIISMLENTKSNVNIFLINNEISDASRKKIEHSVSKYKNAKIEFLDIDINKYFSGFKTWQHVSLTAFARLLIPWLKPKLNRAIWVDGDVIFMDDVSKLYNQDLGGFAIGAAKAIEIGNDLKTKFYSLLDLNKQHTYFNSGVLLMDCKKMREDKNLPDGFFEIERKYPGHLCADQDILNKYFENNYKRLEQKFNVTCCGKDVFENENEYTDTMENMVIRHFIGAEKPNNSINSISTTHLASYYKFWDYAQNSQFFGDFIIKLFRKYGYEPRKKWVNLFGVIPFLKIKNNKVLLFGALPIITLKDC
jgi:lipopolysaccharide biosynthesis glycosyltransferase